MIDSLPLIFLITSLISYLSYKAYIYPLYLSPLCKIPGPPPDNFLLGNLIQIIKLEVGIPHIAWTEKYGGVIMYRGLFNKQRIFMTDAKALQRVMTSYDYPKPPGFNFEFNSLTSENELAKAYTMVFIPENRRSIFTRLLSNYIPLIDKLPTEYNIRKREASRIIDQVSTKLVTEKLEKAKLVPLTVRTSKEDDVINGYKIPKYLFL
ncbi:1327_t:CDS:2 [Funneliformis caledonium]|uniref:1327_t:CDS:1 n=1 Tax=Funneliformis caledonium TaxID=1117310 RepID=A0A9N9E3Q7_9GLOM|nr:1327_t:CDS:2 [Funneliformis caledonium]